MVSRDWPEILPEGHDIVDIQVFHNLDDEHRFLQYHSGDQLARVARFSLGVPQDASSGQILEHVFEKENIGEHDGRRSLSVSDVVAINGEPWSVESIGWAKVDKADLERAGARYPKVR